MKKNKRITNNIKKYRRSCGLTQGDLAQLLGHKNSNRVCTMERDTTKLRPEEIFALTAILDQPFNRIFPIMLLKSVLTIEKNAKQRLKVLKPSTASSPPLYQSRLKRLQELSQHKLNI